MKSAEEYKTLKRLFAQGKSFEFIAEHITDQRAPGPKGYVFVKTPGGVAWDAFNLGLITEEERERWYRERKKDRATKRAKNREKFRAAVIERDGHKCRVCGATQDLEVDHIIDFQTVQMNEASNGITLCKACHKKKTHPSRFTSADRYDESEMKRKERRMVDEHAFVREYALAVETLGYVATFPWCPECRGHHVVVTRPEGGR